MKGHARTVPLLETHRVVVVVHIVFYVQVLSIGKGGLLMMVCSSISIFLWLLSIVVLFVLSWMIGQNNEFEKDSLHSFEKDTILLPYVLRKSIE